VENVVFCILLCIVPVLEIHGDTKKREFLKNPTKIVEIQKKKNIDRN
jgi:hypothetical protein